MALTPLERLRDLGLELPALVTPLANYVSWKRAGELIFLSGQGPRGADGERIVGKVGHDVTVELACDCARQIGLGLLAAAQAAAGGLERVEVIKVLGMVNATPDFREHPKVINGCSDLFVQVLGDRGLHARSAVGVASLPGGIPVEIEAIMRVA
ncbi:MAG: RidA family protein [Phenylobacterium sp.]|uniref:RidA family protein n=1 Tax=Phenylobacterium sp. TaxID=1871053 RepID=UPI0027329CDF|nr:RidA family protein [Phenylobacterium sp.]MDP3173050.1 RidA family protein [Phenylobacterium sp.]